LYFYFLISVDLSCLVVWSELIFNAVLQFAISCCNSYISLTNLVWAGSEGKLSLPYQRIGAINALKQLSRSPPKQVGRLAHSVSSFLLTCYKDDGKVQ
jgi:hypothetical protein